MSAVNRASVGALAGIAATAAMTAAMTLLFRHLSSRSRYPLPPRELIEALDPTRRIVTTDRARARATTFAHFGYGALTGALFALSRDRSTSTGGVVYGLGVWGASYLGGRAVERAGARTAP